jgi:hypothetical protein
MRWVSASVSRFSLDQTSVSEPAFNTIVYSASFPYPPMPSLESKIESKKVVYKQINTIIKQNKIRQPPYRIYGNTPTTQADSHPLRVLWSHDDRPQGMLRMLESNVL